MKQRKALIFNQYIETAGGGERLCFELAAALEKIGFKIDFVIASDAHFEVSATAKRFGIVAQSEWSLMHVRESEEIYELCKAGGYEVFVNNTYGSFIENSAPIGLYVAMFPQHISEEQKVALKSYNIAYCISGFTDLYVKLRWDISNTRVIIPPISEVNFTGSQTSFETKEKLILCVGRFNVRGHSKRQLEAINTFVKLQDAGVIDSEWKLVVAGRVNEGVENLAYLGECLKAASKNVSIYEGLPLDDLISFYKRASVLWQFTGIGISFGKEPELCEHLGLVALDALAFGTVPMVFQRSGVAYLIEHAVNGYCFSSVDELSEIMKLFSQNFSSKFHRYQYESSRLTAEQYSFELFVEQLNVLLNEVTEDRQCVNQL
jgi:glycosyltransferase involved in cell wall biosynthesis